MKMPIARLLALSLLFTPLAATANDSAVCGPMCHVSMTEQGSAAPMAPRGPEVKSGDLLDMYARLDLHPSQYEAWEHFVAKLSVGTPPYSSERNRHVMMAFSALRKLMNETQRTRVARHFGAL